MCFGCILNFFQSGRRESSNGFFFYGCFGWCWGLGRFGGFGCSFWIGFYAYFYFPSVVDCWPDEPKCPLH